MALPPFPSSPTDGETFEWLGRLYEYEDAANTWWPIGAAAGVTGGSISLGSATAPANPQTNDFWLRTDGKGFIRQHHPGPPPTDYWWQIF